MDIENASAPRGITLKDSRIVQAEDILLELVNFYYRSEWEDDDFKGMTKEELKVHDTEQKAVGHILHELYQLANDYEYYFKHPRKIKRVENKIELYCECIDEITENDIRSAADIIICDNFFIMRKPRQAPAS